MYTVTKSEINSLVSIIMPCFNGESTLKLAIDSVLAQDYDEWELIITDDFSNDNSAEIIKSYKDKRIVYLLNEEGKGVSNARNNSIKHANGKFIAFLDCDDVWHRNKLSQQLKKMQEFGCHVSHSSYHRIDKNNTTLSTVNLCGVVTYKDMLTGNKIGNLTGIYNCEALGKFYQKNIGHEDYLMWLSILQKSNSIGLREPLASYRVSVNSLSGNKLKVILWHYNILRNELKLSRFASAYYFCLYLKNALLKRV